MGDHTLEVLKGVDFSLKPGEFIAIEGRSGSGKSTLMHILAALDYPETGSVEFDGIEIGEMARQVGRRLGIGGRFMPFKGAQSALIQLLSISVSRADRKLARIRNTQFGFVFQFYYLLPELNVLENTLLAAMVEHSWFSFRANGKKLKARATEVLEQLGMSHRLRHRPNQLSGGERQRVAIARALMNRPRVLFADEPTGNLDAQTGRQIMDVLESLHRDQAQTIVMVTHDRTLARQADRVLVLKDGKLERAEP
jgi:lipoprotein-releasing system ATP-binding protein